MNDVIIIRSENRVSIVFFKEKFGTLHYIRAKKKHDEVVG